jgi:hypothetical protein
MGCQISCPACGCRQILRVPDTGAGYRLSCKKCGETCRTLGKTMCPRTGFDFVIGAVVLAAACLVLGYAFFV